MNGSALLVVDRASPDRAGVGSPDDVDDRVGRYIATPRTANPDCRLLLPPQPASATASDPPVDFGSFDGDSDAARGSRHADVWAGWRHRVDGAGGIPEELE